MVRWNAASGGSRLHLADVFGLWTCGRRQQDGSKDFPLSALWTRSACRCKRGTKYPRKGFAPRKGIEVNGGARRGSLFRGINREVGPDQRERTHRSDAVRSLLAGRNPRSLGRGGCQERIRIAAIGNDDLKWRQAVIGRPAS